MSKPKVMSWTEHMKKAFPERRITDEEAEAGRLAFEKFAKQAAEAGWTPEYVAALPNGVAKEDDHG